MKVPKLVGTGGLKKFTTLFWVEDGNKQRLNFPLIGVFMVPILLIGTYASVFFDREDTSFITQMTGGPAEENEVDGTVAPSIEPGASPHSSLIQENNPEKKVKGVRRIQIKYSAKQVLDRSVSGDGLFMPIGSNLVGKLLTAIDTRDESQLVKVLLPYGGVFQGSRRIERNSTLFGSAQYDGSGDKVFLRFSRLLGPDGTEFQIQAHALSSKDYSPGLAGDVHTNMNSRIVSAIGLSMLSAGSDVLIDREALGESFSATPKATLKNAAMAGVSKAAQMEAERRASDAESETPYVTVEVGTELIVSLTESFKGKLPDGE